MMCVHASSTWLILHVYNVVGVTFPHQFMRLPCTPCALLLCSSSSRLRFCSLQLALRSITFSWITCICICSIRCSSLNRLTRGLYLTARHVLVCTSNENRFKRKACYSAVFVCSCNVCYFVAQLARPIDLRVCTRVTCVVRLLFC